MSMNDTNQEQGTTDLERSWKMLARVFVIAGLIGWFAYRHFAQKKRQADRRNWGVDYRDTPICPMTRRLPWRDL